MKVYAAVAGMIAQTNKIDLIANNVANMNTIGFKEQLSNTKTFTRENNISEYPTAKLPFERDTLKSKKFILNTLNDLPIESETFKNTRQGSFRETGNPLDFSLVGREHFFLVRNQEGQEFLTKAGNFKYNENGVLITQNNEYVLSEAKGLITNDNIEEMGVWEKKFEDLKNVGDNLYSFDKLDVPLPLDEEPLILTGYLEDSNVNSIRSMTELINAQRLLDQLKSVVETQQDMEKKSNTSIGDHQS